MNAPAHSREQASTGSHVLDDLAVVIGVGPAMALAWEFRGQRLYVPQEPAREPRIAGAIGEELASKLCDAFWRTTVTVPMNVVLAWKVGQLAAAGITKREIARQCCIREARVYAILAAARESDQRQLPLF